MQAPFQIDLKQQFMKLTKPPIMEAMIHWQARSTTQFQPTELHSTLLEKLPEFTDCDPVQQFALTALSSGADQPPAVHQRQNWYGYRLKTADKLSIAQFTRDGIGLSRLRPYQDWETFTNFAKKIWQTYKQIAVPLDFQRMSVRYINQLPDVTFENIRYFLKEPPTCPSNLPLTEFVYQSTFAVPTRPYTIRVIKVMQPASMSQNMNAGLFLDFEVNWIKPMSLSDPELEAALVDMRWLKNKIFFELLTDEAIANFK